MEFGIGEWVREKSSDKIGFIEEIQAPDFYGSVKVFVWFVRYGGGKPMEKQETRYVNSNNLVILPVSRIYTDGEVDLALLTNDEEWFKELMALKGGAKWDGIK